VCGCGCVRVRVRVRVWVRIGVHYVHRRAASWRAIAIATPGPRKKLKTEKLDLTASSHVGCGGAEREQRPCSIISFRLPSSKIRQEREQRPCLDRIQLTPACATSAIIQLQIQRATTVVPTTTIVPIARYLLCWAHLSSTRHSPICAGFERRAARRQAAAPADTLATAAREAWFVS
jgi:hypothetical protein